MQIAWGFVPNHMEVSERHIPVDQQIMLLEQILKLSRIYLDRMPKCPLSFCQQSVVSTHVVWPAPKRWSHPQPSSKKFPAHRTSQHLDPVLTLSRELSQAHTDF